ncbi:MAG: ice-binding family protein [Candidatus Marinimicrobia bacterium]|nr:ice-binding family protein [Candidatus Neomarinimicrobiota bacterium]
MKTAKRLLFVIVLLPILGIIGCSTNGVDTTAPTVTSVTPADGATDVAINTNIGATFSEPMDTATLTATSVTLKQGATAVAGSLSYSGTTVTFNPTADLAYDTEYTATITVAATDEAGNALAENMVWSFTSGQTLDTSAPTVSSTIPANAATGVAINSNIRISFSEAMDHATIVAANVTLKQGSTAVNGTVTYDIPNHVAIFAPAENLVSGTEYTATVTTSVTDLAGNTLATNKVWSFTTAASGSGPAPVSLGTAGNFAILAKTEISSVPASNITGDIGLSPAAETYITGFSLTDATGYATSTQVTGFIYAADMTPPTPTVMTTAISDMETAYTDAAGRSTPDFSDLGAGEIGGSTLAPGLYTWGSSVTAASDFTIDGNANDVWIFQISGDLGLSSAVNVTLSGGAQAENIFWQVAGTVTLGTTAHFEGIVLSQTSIILNTSSTINGRLLAQSAVALDQSTVTEPTP